MHNIEDINLVQTLGVDFDYLMKLLLVLLNLSLGTSFVPLVERGVRRTQQRSSERIYPEAEDQFRTWPAGKYKKPAVARCKMTT